MLVLLVRRVEARRARATADVGDEWPKRRGNAACRRTRGCRGEGSGGSTVAVAVAGAVAWGRYRGGGGVLPMAFHGGARRGRFSAGVRSEQPERRGSVARRETQECRGQGLGVRAAATAGVITTCASRTARARIESERCEGRSGNEEEGALQAGNHTFLWGSSTSSSDHESHEGSGGESSAIRGVTIKST